MDEAHDARSNPYEGPVRPPAGEAGVGHYGASAYPLDEVRLEDLAFDSRRLETRRRVMLPLFLLVATCLSTFWAGATDWTPTSLVGYEQADDALMPMRRMIVRNGGQGLAYMSAMMGILLAHEMGHFLTTVYYRIPASLPYCIPFPINPLGTMGAVISMAGFKADRKQLFDIGLAGPLAGLVIAIPVLYFGIQQLDFKPGSYGGMALDCPRLVRIMISYMRPDLGNPERVWISQLNPLFMAGWGGLLITGLNMLPVSQLDGGHVVYALFRRRAHWIARGFVIFAIAFVVLADATMWALMLVLVILLGADHPPTANDQVPLGRFRIALGYLSLLIPFLCFPPRGILFAP